MSQHRCNVICSSHFETKSIFTPARVGALSVSIDGPCCADRTGAVSPGASAAAGLRDGLRGSAGIAAASACGEAQACVAGDEGDEGFEPAADSACDEGDEGFEAGDLIRFLIFYIRQNVSKFIMSASSFS